MERPANETVVRATASDYRKGSEWGIGRGQNGTSRHVPVGARLLMIVSLAIHRPAAGQLAPLLLAALLAAEPAFAQTAPATLRGTVVARATGEPLADARVTVVGLGSATVTDAEGAFGVRLNAAGEYTVEARRLGYATARVALRLEPGQTTLLAMVLDLAPVAIAPVAVAADAAPHATSKLRGFHERRQRGNGHFVTREEIERRGASQISHLFPNVPGLSVVHTQGGGSSMRSDRNRRLRDCPITVYVDGMHYQLSIFEISEIHPRDIEAVEFYPSVAQAPPQFRIRSAACGVLVIWLRERI
jgi:hypothetical protein